MIKAIYKNNIHFNEYKMISNFNQLNDIAFIRVATIFSYGEIDYLLRDLLYSKGHMTVLYDITDWDENIYIIGLNPMNLHGKLERENLKISVNKKEFIVLVQLWQKLASENAEEIILEKNGDIITVSGNGKKAAVDWEYFKYDWEDDDDEVYDFGLDR